MLRSDEDVVQASSLLDVEYYSSASGEFFIDRISAVRHYIAVGSRAGLNPSRYFDTKYYLNSNLDVANAELNPLAHYLNYGIYEGRRPRIGFGPLTKKPQAPRDEEWASLFANFPKKVNQFNLSDVKVLIPVYKGYDDTLACIYSVLTSENRSEYDLVVINDAGPDRHLNLELRRLAGMGAFKLIENETNEGFVYTVNRGISEYGMADIILLNSDTIVYNDWIDRLFYHANSFENVATVTPFSNNATIFSYPFTDRNNNQDLELEFSKLDDIFSRVNSRQNVTVPTGVGFCFYITRRCLDGIGVFDQSLFGRGYGEENDFCMRCSEAGFVNLAALDVFVRHTGEVSFSDTAQASKDKAMMVLTAVHSRYLKNVQKFVRGDSMRKARAAVDIERAGALSRRRGVLHVEHGWGGGVERHILDLEKLAALEGVSSFRLNLKHGGEFVITPSLGMPDFPNLPLVKSTCAEDLGAMLRGLGIRRVHIHSLLGYSDAQKQAIVRAAKFSDAKIYFTAHDYAAICPKINMIDMSGGYCSSPSPMYCQSCVTREPSEFGDVNIDEWRRGYEAVLSSSYKVFVPNSDVSSRLGRYVGNHIDYTLKPPPYRPARKVKSAETIPAGVVRRIAVIGAIGPHKGSRVLEAMATDAVFRKLNIRFTLFGYSDIAGLSENPSIKVTGRYREEEFGSLLEANPCEIALFLSVWPETFSYTLDLALENNLFPVSIDLGAPAERIRQIGFGACVPLEYIYNASLINDYLVRLDVPAPPSSVDEPGREWRSMADYYA